MITRWTIGNFKSIAAPVEIEMAPLTLVCGANSSGKSTILQSILAVAQTFRSSNQTRALTLNGQLTRLGLFRDLLHAGGEKQVEAMHIGFGLEDRRQESNGIQDIELDAEVQQVSDGEGEYVHRGLPLVSRYQLGFSTRSPQGDREYYSLGLDYEPYYVWPEFEHTVVELRGLASRSALNEDIRTSHMHLSGLYPISMLVEYNVAVREASQAFDRLIAIISDVEPPELSEEVANAHVSREILVLLQQVSRQPGIWFQGELGELLRHGERGDLTWKRLLASVRVGWSFRLDDKGKPQDRGDEYRKLREVLRDRLLGLHRNWLEEIKQASQSQSYERRHLPFSLQSVIDFMTTFWIMRFAYLGPLRDDPKVVFALPPDVERRSVGVKGEYTAAVLTERGDDKITMPLPPTKGNGTKFHTKQATLGEAVVIWLRHMGLVDNVSTRELAKIGYELMVEPAGLGKPLDLMNVGVGVSQVLPTLVMSLIAPEGATLVFEQPELHLHPKVQSILGDFLLGISAMGKQCIVETHSEHLINRVRRRIAESEGEEVMRLVRIYFAEKPETMTKIIPVEPNEYGAIPDWPEGFFDEVANETDLIVEAARQKKLKRLEAARGMRGRKRQ
jgi:predicted ATPase